MSRLTLNKIKIGKSKGRLFLVSLLAASSLLCNSQASNAQSWKPIHTFFNPSPAENDFFNYSVALDGNKALIGAIGDDTGAKNTGAAYLFDTSTGDNLHKLLNPNPDNFDQFGISVDLSGDKALVGAYVDDTGGMDLGRAYLFDTVSGQLIQTLLNPNPASGDSFGYSVAISGDKALVGAYSDDVGMKDTGAAYLFDTNTGELLQILLNPNPSSGDGFGHSVALDGNKALIGAYNDSTTLANTGAAYLFDTTTGNMLKALTSPNPAKDDDFGYSVALEGDKALVGAIGDDTGASNAGAAYLFDTATGNLLHTLLKSVPASGDYFGNSVILNEGKALVGAPLDDTRATDAGAAYLFDTTTGTLSQGFFSSTPTNGHNFGFTVGMNGDKLIVGTHLDDTGASNAGAAYLFGPSAESVPEPTMLGASLLGFIALFSRKRSKV